MKIRISDLRRIIREVAGEPVVLYHGTLRTNLPKILRDGLRSGFGWGAEKAGVFLSANVENAAYWARRSHATKVLGLGRDAELPLINDSEIAVLRVTIPADFTENLRERRTSFSKPEDMQYVGDIPPEWIRETPIPMQRVGVSELRRFIRMTLLENPSGPGVTADPTEIKGFYPYEVERGVDIQGYWYKSPGRSIGADGDPGRPEDAAEYIGQKPPADSAVNTPGEDAAADVAPPPIMS